jgi:ABC-2 type transport system permease protein
MKLRPIAGIVLRQVYLMRGSPVRLFPMVTWVAIDIVLWGFITRYLNTVSGAGMDFVPTLLGGVLLWDFCTRIMQGVTTAFLEDVWSRNFCLPRPCRSPNTSRGSSSPAWPRAASVSS